MTKLDSSKIEKTSVHQGESTFGKVKKALKDAKDYTVENLGRRGIITVLIIIGIIILAVGLLLLGMNQYTLQDIYQMSNLGLLTAQEYNFRIYELYKVMNTNRMIAQIGAIITAIFLIIAAISPISGKGTPYFSEYVRLGLLAFGALMVYVAVYI